MSERTCSAVMRDKGTSCGILGRTGELSDASLPIDVEGMRRRIGEKDTSAGGSVNDFQLVAIRPNRSAAAQVASQGNVCGSRATPGSPTRFDDNLQQPGDGS